jgi:hypothetical protein
MEVMVAAYHLKTLNGLLPDDADDGTLPAPPSSLFFKSARAL